MSPSFLVHPDPSKHPISLERVALISPLLAQHLAAVVTRHSSERERWPQAPATVRTLLSHLVPGIPRLAGKLAPEHLETLSGRGLDALASDEVWAHVEGACHRDSARTDLMSAFRFFTAVHRDDPAARPPSILNLRAGHSDLSDLYEVSAQFLLDYKCLVEGYDARAETDQSGISFKHRTYSLLALLVRDKTAAGQLRVHGFNAFAFHPLLAKKVEKLRTWQPETALVSLLGEHDPERWKAKTVSVCGHLLDLTLLHSYSRAMFEDIVDYASKLGPSAPAGKSSTFAPDQLTSLQRSLHSLKDMLNPSDLESLRERGFVTLIGGNCRCLTDMYVNRSIAPRVFKVALTIAFVLHPGARREPKQLAPYQVRFANPYADRPLYSDFGPFRDLSVRLYDDLVGLVEHVKSTLAERTFTEATLYQQAQQFRAAVGLCKPHLSPELLRSLREHGLAAFKKPGFKLQKAMYAACQLSARNGSVSTITAYGYKKSVEWWLTLFGCPLVEAFPISRARTTQHLQRLNTDDYYSAEQCRELALHVEKSLEQAKLSSEQRLSLMLARVLLKTGWNLAPTLGIECDDIVRSTSPLDPHSSFSVVLQKKRAGYRSDTYSFDDPHTSVATMKSAVTDLLEIRDHLTSELRCSLPDSNPYKSFIFLYEKDGVVQRLSAAAIKVISALLVRSGASITFDSKRIRKGGMNHLYRKVQKDGQAYEQNAKHDIATFEAHYLRLDQNQSRSTLGRAVDVMGRYFSGKEISKEIVIATEVSPNSQQTPMGECASGGSDQEAKLYNLEHKKLLAERSATADFCADFLGCIWCKYFRLVIDPDHVWRLLSYRDFVLQSMQFSVVGLPDEDQQINVDILKGRVAEMLEKLEARSPGITQRAELLQVEHGMHPDWSFSLADGTNT